MQNSKNLMICLKCVVIKPNVIICLYVKYAGIPRAVLHTYQWNTNHTIKTMIIVIFLTGTTFPLRSRASQKSHGRAARPSVVAGRIALNG